ncbi:MAG: heavy-metal-associated domain-containing protein [Nitrospinaceae bacterium]
MLFGIKWLRMLNLLAGVFVLLHMGAPSAISQEESSVYKMHVNGLSCPFCDFGIDKNLSSIDGVEKIDVDLAEGAVIITMTAGKVLTEKAAKQAIQKAGFTPRDFQKVQIVEQAQNNR